MINIPMAIWRWAKREFHGIHLLGGIAEASDVGRWILSLQQDDRDGREILGAPTLKAADYDLTTDISPEAWIEAAISDYENAVENFYRDLMYARVCTSGAEMVAEREHVKECREHLRQLFRDRASKAGALDWLLEENS